MPKINGIEISDRAAEELMLLVDEGRKGTNLLSFTKGRLNPERLGDYPDKGLVETYESLCDKDLISGRGEKGQTFIFTGMKQEGRNWIDDYRKEMAYQKKREEAVAKEEKSKRKHDYFVVITGAIAGSALTLLIEHGTEIPNLLLNLLSIPLSLQ